MVLSIYMYIMKLEILRQVLLWRSSEENLKRDSVNYKQNKKTTSKTTTTTNKKGG